MPKSCIIFDFDGVITDDYTQPLPGLPDLLTFLKKNNIPCAIYSGARKKEILTTLDSFKLRHHFTAIVSIEDVRHPKPEPEGYNKAFDLLNLAHDATLEKEHSLVIEDSEAGCYAARAAGLRVLGVATNISITRLQYYTDFAIKNLAQLDHKILAGWLGLH